MKQIILNNQDVALIDDDDYNLISMFKWSCSNGYATTPSKLNKGTILMHRLIMVPKQGFEIHHKDGNKLNNQKANLEPLSYSAHSRTKGTKRNISGYKGIYQDNRTGTWIASIMVNRKKKYLGSSKDPEVAARIYDKEVLHLFGPNNYFNFPLKPCPPITSTPNDKPTP